MALKPSPGGPLSQSGVDDGIVDALYNVDPRTMAVNPLLEFSKSAPMPMEPDAPREGPDWQFYIPRSDHLNLSSWDSPWYHEEPGLTELTQTDMMPMPNTTAYHKVNIQPSVYGSDLQAMLSSNQQVPATFAPSSP